jgi:hypothetical protein
VKHVWMILSAAFALIAVFFFARHDYDNAFICAALGAVAWFLRYRTQLKELVKANEPAEETSESLDSHEEE